VGELETAVLLVAPLPRERPVPWEGEEERCLLGWMGHDASWHLSALGS